MPRIEKQPAEGGSSTSPLVQDANDYGVPVFDTGNLGVETYNVKQSLAL